MKREQNRHDMARTFSALGVVMTATWFAGVQLAVLGSSSVSDAAENAPHPPPIAQAESAKVKSYTPSTIYLDVSVVLGAPPKARPLTYVLVTPPKHGSVVLPEPRETEATRHTAPATYTSARDFVGEDEFSWKVSDGWTDSNVATTKLEIRTAVPAPEPQMAPMMEGASVDFTAAYTGGGGYAYKIQAGKPAHGALSVEGSTFHYRPESGFTGIDQFDWYMIYPTEKGEVKSRPVTCGLVVKAPGIKDWSQWRADEWRSGFTTMKLPAALHLQWRRDFPATKSPFVGRGPDVYRDIDYCRPVQLGKTIFVPVTASDCLMALDTDTGAVRWRFYASGAVRRPPAAVALAGAVDLVIFGSDDGWLYALNAGDGSVRWKFRAAPNNRKAMGFGRLSSAWPIWASPVASEGKIYAAAGYVMGFGLYAYCLDAATGDVVWENDGRILDVWNTSALGPLAMSFDRAKLYGTVEGACTPWILDAATGNFLGHLSVGFAYPAAMRSGYKGWYVDGSGTHGPLKTYPLDGQGLTRDLCTPEPMTITVGSRTVTAADAANLGVKGIIASLLAGDGKLFVTTEDGSLYCFGEKAGQAAIHPWVTSEPPAIADGWTAMVARLLSRKDLNQGLALVLGLGSGRLVEELARQSSLTIVAVDPDHAKLQAFRAKMEASGYPAARVATLAGKPLDFEFAPYQAAIIASEDLAAAGFPPAAAGQEAAVQNMIGTMYNALRPLGGELWLPTSNEQHALVAEWAAASSNNLPLAEVVRQTGHPGAADGFTHMKRQGLPADKLRLEPPFGLAVFTSRESKARERDRESDLGPDRPGVIWPGRDTYTWLPLAESPPGQTARDPGLGEDQVFKTRWPGESKATTKRRFNLSTSDSVYGRLKNPLYGSTEKFSGVPDGAVANTCGGVWHVGDVGISYDKMVSFFDASAWYWGRLFVTGFGGCPGWTGVGSGLFFTTGHALPGNFCGCSPDMQFTDIILVPMAGEETWVAYQDMRTSQAVEELPIRQIGVNFGAPGDRYVRKDGTLWTHHPYAGLQGRHSHSDLNRPEALPLVPVRYRGKPVSVYHHSAQMARGCGDRNWVAASYVKGMTEISVPLAQPVVALRAAAAPNVDGDLGDACWDGGQRLSIVPDSKVSKPDEECYALFRYDDTNLYVAGGASGAGRGRWPMSVTLNDRERVGADVILTCGDGPGAKVVSKGIPAGAWTCAATTSDTTRSAEIAVSWKALEEAGLWKEHVVVNVAVNDSRLTGTYTPLYVDTARGPATAARPHTVRLTFAEMEGKKAGERVFNVSLQGRPVLANLDVVKEAAGAKRELTREVKGVDIADRLTIGFEPVAGEAMLSGVEIAGEYRPGEFAPNVPPEAEIEASALSGPAPLEVRFSARGSRDPDGQIVQCAWDTGDGRLAKGSLLKHVYAEPGVHQVHLLVRDNRGGMAAAQTTVTVTPGVPAAFVCAIRAEGGDYATLSAWETAMRGHLTVDEGERVFAVKDRCGEYKSDDDGSSVSFAGGGKGRLKRIVEGAGQTGVAYISGCSGTINPGRAACDRSRWFEIADAGRPLGPSLLFTVKDRGTYAPGDDGAAVTFAGGTKGILRHINAADLAYITDCEGAPQAGKVTCASGHTLEIADAGHPVYAVVAEVYHDWPGGLADSISAPQPEDSRRWFADALHAVTIRPAAGHGHRGTPKDAKGSFAGVALKGNLDLAAIPHARLRGLIVEPGGTLAMGRGASLSRVLAGEVRLGGGSMAANVVGCTLGVASAPPGVLNYHPSYYSWLHYFRSEPPHWKLLRNARVSFYNCTAATFDPNDQPEVEFINCLAVPGGKGFHDDQYPDGAYANHCVSADGTAVRWDSGDGSEGNAANQKILFVNPAEEDYHLLPTDKGARGRGAPGLGPDIDGQERPGPAYEVGADSLNARDGDR